MGIIHLSGAEFEEEVLHSRQLVLVDFWAPWCGPCKMIAPILEELAQQKEYDNKVKICKVNVDENQTAASRYHVLSIPTLLFFKQGEVTSQLVGVRSAANIKKTIDSLL